MFPVEMTTALYAVLLSVVIDRQSGFCEFKKKISIQEFYWILKMPAEFYFEICYFNFDCNITIILLHNPRNTQQWQAHDITATVSKMLMQKNLFHVHLNSVVLNFIEF